MARRKGDVIETKRTAWLERTAAALNVDSVTAEHLLKIPRTQSVRINPLVGNVTGTVNAMKAVGWRGVPIDWCPNGYTIEDGLEQLKSSDLATTGAIYIQNAASWLPVVALALRPGEDVLDICAAPGGKTAHMAAVTDNVCHITANDNSRIRLAKLRANLTRLGVTCADTTLFDATKLATKLEGRLFDKILLDAPCSGEGMMTIDNDKDFASWSVAHIKRLQQLQKRMIQQAWYLLRPGGTLVYSTCTMAPEENEAVIDFLLRRNNDAVAREIKHVPSNRVPAVASWSGKAYQHGVQFATRLVPSLEAEAFFVCKIEKLDNQDNI